jgi:3-oxoacyl-[acyl-carrier protein] reductase
MDLGLSGKVALVTGGSRGIGRAIVGRLAAEGCAIGICGRTPERLEAVLAELRAAGTTAHGVVADVTAPGEVERFVDEAAAALGGADLLVANVGGNAGGTLMDSTAEDWVQTFEMNLFHAVRAIRAAVPHFERRGGGSVVTIASVSGVKPAPRAQYGAAKAGEIFLSGALALELAAKHIRVNTISPGSIMFPGGGWAARRERDPEGFGEFERREFPAGRLGSAEEVANVVAFVLSERASWVNGTNIAVDGAQGRPTMF